MTLNGKDHPLDPVPERWEDLLRRLDDEAAERGEVVAAVRFDGVDEPTFRETARWSEPVQALGVIEVETARPYDLLADALSRGAETARCLAASAGEVAAEFRGGRLVEANEHLREFVDGLALLLSLVSAVAGALGVTLDGMEWNGQPVSARVGEFAGRLEALVEAHESLDWLKVADVLEYDFQPTVASWPAMLDSLRASAEAA